MERREAIINISWILKSACLAPTVFTGLLSCKMDVSNFQLSVFSMKQYTLVNAIADTILPRTQTPSASDVNVNLYMDLLLNEVFEETYRKSFIKGLEQFDKHCNTFTGSFFLDLNKEERHDYLNVLDKKASTLVRTKSEPFFSRFKVLTVKLYFSTEQGVKQNLTYVPLPGPFLGDVEIVDGAKIMIGN